MKEQHFLVEEIVSAKYLYMLWLNLSLVHFLLLFNLFLCMVMYDNEYKTKEIKIELIIKLNDNIYMVMIARHSLPGFP